MVFNANLAIFQLCHGENKFIFNEMIMLRSVSYSPRVNMSPHSDTLSWFRDNQSLLFLLNAACLVDKQQVQYFSLMLRA